MRPILHEPGPFTTSYFLAGQGIPVHRGQVLRVNGTYDGEHPRARVMSVMHVYVAKGGAAGAPAACAPLPKDRKQVFLRSGGRVEPPYEKVPLNVMGADGRIHEIQDVPGPMTPFGGDATIDLQGGLMDPDKIQIPAGAAVTWRFRDSAEHAMVFANGPAVAGTPTLGRGATHVSRFTKPGTYQLFCYLHPLTMHEEIVVTPR
jgi:hypothetical protein